MYFSSPFDFLKAKDDFSFFSFSTNKKKVQQRRNFVFNSNGGIEAFGERTVLSKRSKSQMICGEIQRQSFIRC